MLPWFLQQFGYNADELTSDLSQKDREQVLERIRKGTLRYLVATGRGRARTRSAGALPCHSIRAA